MESRNLQILIKTEKTCRLCLSSISSGRDIFQERISMFTRPLFEIIEMCTSVMLVADNGGPNLACDTCVNFLKQWENFRILVINSNEAFNREPLSPSVSDSPDVGLPDDDCGDVNSDYDQSTVSAVNDEECSPKISLSERSLTGAIKEEGLDISVTFKVKEKLAPQSSAISKEVQTSQRRKCAVSNVTEKKKKTLTCMESRQEPKEKKNMETKDGAKQASTYECKFCEKRYNCPTSLNRHLLDHGIAKPYECSHCSKRFLLKGSLKTHIQSQHTRDFRFTCELCGRGFVHTTDFNRHKFIHSGERPFKCQHCSWAFPCQKELQQHQHVHSDIRPYTCHECGKSFRWPKGLKTHLLSHSGGEPQTCPVCKKQLNQNTTLRYHMLTHTGEKPYRCETCGKGFIQQSNMKRHQRQHNVNKSDLACKICKKSCKSRNGLTLHSRTHGADL